MDRKGRQKSPRFRKARNARSACPSEQKMRQKKKKRLHGTHAATLQRTAGQRKDAADGQKGPPKKPPLQKGSKE